MKWHIYIYTFNRIKHHNIILIFYIYIKYKVCKIREIDIILKTFASRWYEAAKEAKQEIDIAYENELPLCRKNIPGQSACVSVSFFFFIYIFLHAFYAHFQFSTSHHYLYYHPHSKAQHRSALRFPINPVLPYTTPRHTTTPLFLPQHFSFHSMTS